RSRRRPGTQGGATAVQPTKKAPHSGAFWHLREYESRSGSLTRLAPRNSGVKMRIDTIKLGKNFASQDLQIVPALRLRHGIQVKVQGGGIHRQSPVVLQSVRTWTGFATLPSVAQTVPHPASQ